LGFEEIGLSYAKTLHHWRQRFLAKLDEVKALGFDETFIRMWDFYLCYCEGGFRERAIATSQLVFAKPGWRAGQEQQNASGRH
jgi:cyclopropane-fatty-acyl-phospholipid synthase